jgi:hypothetical protein
MSGIGDRPMTQQGPVWEVAELFPDRGSGPRRTTSR